MSRPIQASIDLAAVRHNYQIARRHAAASRAWAVVKADAYGHGLLRVASALGEQADGFALLDVDAALLLREQGYRQPILLLEGVFTADELQACAQYGLTPVVHRLDQLRAIGAATLTKPLSVYLKLNTGMNRLGLTAAEVPAARSALEGLPGISSVTLMTHFADADGDRGTAWQLERFAAMSAGWDVPRSLANSAAILRHPQTHADWVRPGIMLYGGSPFADASADSLGLRPVMTLSSRIIAVQELAAGERVGYGGIFRAERPMRVGVVACGYADGYPRHATSGTPILVNDRRTRTLGRVSMDMLACDLSDLPDAGVGSAVTLWGAGLPADEVAEAAGTVSYELFCALAPRVPVVVTGDS